MGKFLVKQTKTGFVFNLKANNGQVIATSEVYTTRSACDKGIASVAKNAPIADVEDQTEAGFKALKNPKFEVYKDKKGEFRFRLKAKNGQIIAVSEGYTTMSACDNGIASVKKNAPDAEIVTE
ncbi:MAG: YegP family protein [Christensenellaceae bacterium]|nr:YegP family protein [Christensenellaceae bacterium]